MKNIAELLVSYINLQYLYDIITVAKNKKKHFLDYILLHVSAFVFWAQQSSAGKYQCPHLHVSLCARGS